MSRPVGDRLYRGAPKIAQTNIVGPARKSRCAVYTRKSTDEGLDMDFNSLDAQRESCGAYIASQKAEGWLLVGDRYDDGGFSGGTMERPALKRLLADVQAGKVDVIVVYKIDRLSAPCSISELIELFEHGVTFVGYAVLAPRTPWAAWPNIHYLCPVRRELIGERIRDKVAASQEGHLDGGWTPLGYEVRDHKLIIHEADAKGRSIRRFVGEIRDPLARELVAAGERNR